MKRKVCKHCGRYKIDHEKVHLKHEEAEKVLEGFSVSLIECLQGQGFEAKEKAPT